MDFSTETLPRLIRLPLTMEDVSSSVSASELSTVTVLVLKLLTMLAAFCSVRSPVMSNAPAL